MISKKTDITKTARVFLFCGADGYTAQKKVDAWVEAFAKKHSREGVTRLDAEQSTENIADQIRRAVFSASLFSPIRLVVAKSLFTQKAELMEGVGEILDDLPEDVFVVFWESAAVKKNLKLFKEIFALQKKDKAKIYDFEIPAGRDLNHFIETYVRGKKSAIEPAAAEKLAVYLGRDLSERVRSAGGYDQAQVYNLWQVTSELDKLIAYAGRRSIAPADVEKLVPARTTDNIFLLTDALGKKNTKNARRYLDELLNPSQNRGTDPRSRALMIVGALAGQFRGLLLLASASAEAGSSGQLGTVLGWSDWRVRINLPLLQNFSVSQLKAILGKLLQIDKQMKSTSLPPKVLLSRFISRI